METLASQLDFLTQLNWFDVGVCAVLLMSLVIGLVRGFFTQVAGIVGVIGSLLLAFELSPWVYQLGLEHLPDLTNAIGTIGAFAALFLVTWVLWLILVHYGKRLLGRMEFGAFDRALGGAFGLIKGTLIAYVLLILLHRFTPADWAMSQEFESSRVSQGVEYVDSVLLKQRENIPPTAWNLIQELRGFRPDGPEARRP